MARRQRDTRLPAPYLRALRWDDPEAGRPQEYPFTIPWLTDDFELEFEEPVTILMGENGTGKSTLVEAIAALAGFPTGGGGAWAGGGGTEAAGSSALAARLRAGWLPKVKRGWFLRAGGFEAVASLTDGGYLDRSHGEGFSAVVADRMQGQGVYILDEPEAALSPRRQAELLRFLADIQGTGDAQVIMATHSPILMAVPGAALWRLTHRGIAPVNLRETDHFRLWSAFAADPEGFAEAAIRNELGTLI